MRIVFVDTTIDESFIGGGHLFLPGLMKELGNKGHEVHLVVKGIPEARVRPMIDDSKATVHVRPWKKKGLVQDLAPYFNDWINKLKPDVYVISSSADIGWVVLPYMNPRIATFTLGHNNEETYYLPLRHYHSFITTAVGVSDEVCTQYRTNCNMNREDVEWIPYGVEVREEMTPTASEGPVQLIYVGRVIEGQKRISDLITIAKHMSASGTDYRLQIVGDGDEMPKVHELLRDEIAAGIVETPGWLSKDQVLKALRNADIFVLTSAFEGFSIALTEAMANGCCPVVTDIRSGNQQLITSGENGYLLPVGDTAAFVTVLKNLIADRSKLNAMRMAAWEKGRQYSVERMVAAYEESFARAIEKCKRNPRATDPAFPLMSTCISKYPDWLRRIRLVFVNN